jgi:integrase
MSNAGAASFGRATEILAPTGISLELAATYVAKGYAMLGGDKILAALEYFASHRPDNVTNRTVAEAAAELVAVKKSRGMSDDYTNDLRQRLKRFSDRFGVNIASVTTSDVQKFLDDLNLGAQSVKNFRTVLHTLFEFAEARGYIIKGGNPVASTEGVKVRGGRIQIYTPAEITSLLKAASADFLPLVAIGAFAGLRAAEIERIDWKDIDLAGGFIHVASDKAKTQARRLVPVLPNLALWLANFANHTGKVWQGTSNDVQDHRAACVKASGVAWKLNALRHSFASYRLASIQNAGQVALEMGNSADVVFKHYRELVKPADALKWFGVAPEQPANVTSLAASNG